MPYFNIVAQTTENTVVTEYEPVKARSDSYQSEAELEREFIHMLSEQGYEYLPIHSEAELIANLRKKLEILNSYTFTDSEWDRFFKDALANPNDHIVEKTRKIQEDFVQVLKRDDGSTKNITLIDKKNIHNNLLQVINQYAISQDEGARHSNRYDTNYSTDGDRFQNYYKDVSLRMKNKELDLLIVVNMFLTGFDATTLNTLWVDKNLKMHGLIQAFSRTNRILNSIKTFGNMLFLPIRSTSQSIGRMKNTNGKP